MEWKKFTVTTVSGAEDAVSAMLLELGYESIEIEDFVPVPPEENGGYFGDVVPDMPDDPTSRISFYTDLEEDSSEVLDAVRGGLENLRSFMDIGEGSVTESVTDEEDWVNNWKNYFHTFYVDDIRIEPSWEKTDGENSEDPDGVHHKTSMVLHIDPGTAFGTGAHESTQLAIRALRKYLKGGDEMLDVGTGSGILGIVALKSGASHVLGTDLDENAYPAVRDNLEKNGISEDDFTFIQGNIADDPQVEDEVGYEKYDIAAANIIAEILCDITPKIPPCLKEGGIYITSGILSEKEDMVIRAAEDAGLSTEEITRAGEWSCIVFKK